MERLKVNIALLWLIVVATLGCVLRIYPVSTIDLSYKNILHAHSHVAFLGWIFTSLFTLISILFLKDADKKQFNRQFVVTQIAVVGMLFSFLYQGYGAISIFFSTLHMAASIWFAASVFKVCRPKPNGKSPLSVKFLFAALSFMILSSFGPLSLPVISKLNGAGTPLYSNAIYFYLHFQYNGWFIFTLFALLFRRLETSGVSYSMRTATFLFRALVLSCALTFFLSVLWSGPPFTVWVIAFIGAVLQLVALVSIYILLSQIRLELKGMFRILYYVVLVAFSTKIILQFFSAFPLFAEMASSIRIFVIAYIHLVVLGVVTVSIFTCFIQQELLIISKKTTRIGLVVFLIGFTVSELLAVVQGFANYFGGSITSYNYLQIISAFVILSGVGFIYIGRNTLVRLQVNHLYINSINFINK